MSKYRTRPVVVDAVRFTGDNLAEIAELLGLQLDGDGPADELVIETAEGERKAHVGDWVVLDAVGDAHPCRADLFHASYEPVRTE